MTKVSPEIISTIRKELGESLFQSGDIVKYKVPGSTIEVECRVWLELKGKLYVVESFNSFVLNFPTWSPSKPPDYLTREDKSLIKQLPENNSYFTCHQNALKLHIPAQ